MRNLSATINRTAYGSSGSATADIAIDERAYDVNFRFNGGTMDTVTVGTMADSFPFSGSVSPKKQMLYKTADLGTKGSISKVAFRLKNDSAAGTYNNFEIVMGHTAGSELTATFTDNMADAKTVYSGTFTIPAGLKAGDWTEIPLPAHSRMTAYGTSSSKRLQTWVQ